MLAYDEMTSLVLIKDVTTKQLQETIESKRFLYHAIQNTLSGEECTEEMIQIIKLQIEKNDYEIEMVKQIIEAAKKLPRISGVDNQCFTKLYTSHLVELEKHTIALQGEKTSFTKLKETYQLRKRLFGC